jgi:enoyl-CoA hydratase/carnithine racemase
MGDVRAERRGEVAWLVLDHPERLNAYDRMMGDELRRLVDASADAGVIVITGAGRGFCAGGYLADLADPDPDELRRLFRCSLELFEAIRTSPRPVIAAVNGVAAGGGNELVVACDLAVAAQSATFGQTGPRVGSSPVFGGANFLAHSVGEKRAKEIAFLCRRYSATQAQEMGLVNAVVPDDRLEAEVTMWADELLALSPRYLEITKVSSNSSWNQHRDAYMHGMALLTQAIGSYDMIEGATAFVEKRAPRFEGRDGHRANGEASDGRDAAEPWPDGREGAAESTQHDGRDAAEPWPDGREGAAESTQHDGRAGDAVGDPAPTRLRT